MTLNSVSTLYCICSDAPHSELLARQEQQPLNFKNFLNQHTNCTNGCGTCIDHLRIYLKEAGQYFE